MSSIWCFVFGIVHIDWCSACRSFTQIGTCGLPAASRVVRRVSKRRRYSQQRDDQPTEQYLFIAGAFGASFAIGDVRRRVAQQSIVDWQQLRSGASYDNQDAIFPTSSYHGIGSLRTQAAANGRMTIQHMNVIFRSDECT